MKAPATRADGPMLRLQDVTKEYPGGVAALRGVSVEIPTGDRVAVVGPSGSGKSTMLTIMGTLERPSAGDVEVAEVNVPDASDVQLAGLRAHEIGFVFQAFHLLDSLCALDNVALERVGLAHRLGNRPNQLSGGERQRVAIARAIAKRPRIVFADEPTGNVDSKSGAGVLELLHELGREGATLVLITHDAKVAAGFPRQLQMRDGELVADERR